MPALSPYCLLQRSVPFMVLGLLASCTVGPDYHPPGAFNNGSGFVELKKTTSVDPTTQPSVAGGGSEPLTEWWGTLQDAELDSLEHRAAAGNLDLQRTASRVRQSRSQLGIAGGQLYPQVNASGGYARARGSSNVVFPFFGSSGSGSSTSNSKHGVIRKQEAQGLGGGGGASAGAPLGGPQSPIGEGGLPGVTTDLYQAGLDASWEIDIFGGQRRGIEAASADLAASVEDRRDVLVSLVAEVARDYLELRGLQQRLIIARDNLASQRDTLDLTRSRNRAGFVTDLDVARAMAQVSETEATIPPLESQARQHIHALSVLLGLEPFALTEELSAARPLPAQPPDVPVGLPSELLRRRPDVRRAERQVAAATARVGVAVADLYPKFSITGQAGLDSSQFKKLFDWSSRYFLISPGISWTIFDARRIQNNIASQEEARQQSLTSYQQSVLGALRDVEDALVAYSTEQARHRSLADAVAANRTAVELARQQYEQGIIDFLTVQDAQRQLLTSQDNLIQSQQAVSTGMVALYKSLGGGWQPVAAGL